MSAHDEIIAAWLEVLTPLGGEVRLVGRVHDPLISNLSETDVFLLIPDLHLLSPARQKRFGHYGFNHAGKELLQKLLRRMATLTDVWINEDNKKLITIQLGDFFDMWREFPGVANPGGIPDDAHGDLRDILYRGSFRGKQCLKATMIMGNHDTRNGIWLQEIHSFLLKGFNRSRNDKPFLFVTHGDAFDILETTMPEAIKEFAVTFLGDMTPVKNYPLTTWGKLAGKTNKNFSDMEDAVTTPEHSLMKGNGAPGVMPGQQLPDLFCEMIVSPEDTDDVFFKKVYRCIDIARENNTSGQQVRVVAIGHTHHASMILCRPEGEGRPMVLMNAGAWIENCSYPLAESGTVVTEPSAQLGVIYGNDARIYQIRLPAAA